MDRAFNLNRKRYSLSIVFIITFLAVIVVSIFKFRSDDISHLNTDATWHTLLTIEAYNETPISDHLFLPIVSLGKESDKGIPWGDAISDKNGNYYYTSFSPAGYFLPWVFLKFFHLDVSETSLYIFNSLLFAASAILWVWLLAVIYRKSLYRNWLCSLGAIAYIFTPELLHGMGNVYWHQSVMQVTLAIQLLAYYKYFTHESKSAKVIFYLMALINPYVEWSGYVANVGFALAEFLRYWNKNKMKAFGKSIFLGLITIASFGIFTIHYLLRVDTQTFFGILRARFMARNVTSPTMLTDVFGGYLKSFLYLWVLLLILLIWNFIKNKKLELRNGIVMLVMAFPVIENIIMKEHALSYTYDRMKAIFILSFLICEVARNLLEDNEKPAKNLKVVTGILLLTIVAGLLNIRSYVKSDFYIWKADYMEKNKALSNYVKENHPNALYATNKEVRGYLNLLFDKGIYEIITLDDAIALATEQGSLKVVYITNLGSSQKGNIIENIIVYEAGSEEIKTINWDGEAINEEVSGYQLPDSDSE